MAKGTSEEKDGSVASQPASNFSESVSTEEDRTALRAPESTIPQTTSDMEKIAPHEPPIGNTMEEDQNEFSPKLPPLRFFMLGFG